jgi:hypothetical protein
LEPGAFKLWVNCIRLAQPHNMSAAADAASPVPHAHRLRRHARSLSRRPSRLWLGL